MENGNKKNWSYLGIVALIAILLAGSCLFSSCGSSEASDGNAGLESPKPNTDELLKQASEVTKLQQELQRVETEKTLALAGCLEEAKKELREEEMKEHAKSAEAGLSKIDLSMFATFSLPDSNKLSASGLITMVQDAYDGVWQSPISTPRSSIGELVPSFMDGYMISEGTFLSMKQDLRNPNRVNKFWDKNKGSVILTLKVTGQLGIVSAHASELLKYYEGKIDGELAKKYQAYYDKHKNAGYFPRKAPEFIAVEDSGGGHAGLQNWLFVKRNRDAGGEALIKAHIRVLKDLADPL